MYQTRVSCPSFSIVFVDSVLSPEWLVQCDKPSSNSATGTLGNAAVSSSKVSSAVGSRYGSPKRASNTSTIRSIGSARSIAGTCLCLPNSLNQLAKKSSFRRDLAILVLGSCNQSFDPSPGSPPSLTRQTDNRTVRTLC